MSIDDSFLHALAGSVGGAAAMAVTYPLEQVRTLQQADANVEEIVKARGPGVLYQGCASVIETVAVSNFLYFYTAQYLRKILERSSLSPTLKSLVGSTLAGSANVVLTEPLWKANTILKTGKSDNSNNLCSVLISEARKHGLLSLWAGTGVSLWLVSNPVIQFSVYEYLKRLVLKRKKFVSAMHAFLLGALSKAIATLLTYPLQVAQTRLRMEKGRRTMRAVLIALHADRGIGGLFQGCRAKLAQTVLTAAFMFAFYERILALLATGLKRR